MNAPMTYWFLRLSRDRTLRALVMLFEEMSTNWADTEIRELLSIRAEDQMICQIQGMMEIQSQHIFVSLPAPLFFYFLFHLAVGKAAFDASPPPTGLQGGSNPLPKPQFHLQKSEVGRVVISLMTSHKGLKL